jgi:hypothetical protein
VLLAVQLYAYWDVGILSSWLIGGGLGLVGIGAASWFYYVDDKRHDKRHDKQHAHGAQGGRLPSADEFERRFEEIEPRDADAGRLDA